VLVETNKPGWMKSFPGVQGTGKWKLVLDRRISSNAFIPPRHLPSGTAGGVLLTEEDLRRSRAAGAGGRLQAIEVPFEAAALFATKFPTNAELLAGIPG